MDDPGGRGIVMGEAGLVQLKCTAVLGVGEGQTACIW